MSIAFRYSKKLFHSLLLLVLFPALFVLAYSVQAQDSRSLHDLSVKMNDGEEVKLSKYKGQVLMIANTASKCAFTVQYNELQELHKAYEDKGFSVLGFPSSDFKDQEPGSNEEIKEFCRLHYGVTFPLFAKDHVKGENKSELYRFLTEQSGEDFAGDIQWNFEKFLIDKNGVVRGRYGSFTNPMSTRIQDKVKELLAE